MSEHARQLAVERCRRGRGQHERRDHPGEVLQAAKLARHAWQRCVDDVLVQGGQNHDEQGASQDQAQLPGWDSGSKAELVSVTG
jgi:hypothetical protein